MPPEASPWLRKLNRAPLHLHRGSEQSPPIVPAAAYSLPPAPPPQYPRPPTALPPGWTAVKDKQGDEYYWHQSSGQVTWDRPVS
jgi:hypothetical protein